MQSMNTIIDERIEAYRPFDWLDEMICRFHKRASTAPARSIEIRIRESKKKIREINHKPTRLWALYAHEYGQDLKRLYSLVEHLEYCKDGN